jgi:hypothetical protein
MNGLNILPEIHNRRLQKIMSEDCRRLCQKITEDDEDCKRLQKLQKMIRKRQ